MLDIIWTYRGSLQHIVIVLLAGFAFWRGAGPEKAVGAILLAMIAIARLYRPFDPYSEAYAHVDLGALTQDVLATIAFGALALTANRIYPLWIAAAQIIALLMHFNREISSLIEPLAYAIINRLPSYLQILAFTLGLVAHRRRVRRFGTYRSWRTSLSPWWVKLVRKSPRD